MTDQFKKSEARIKHIFFLIAGFLTISFNTYSQNYNTTDTSQYLTLDQCITYALQHKPALTQSVIGVSIAKTTNAINLAGWLPQVNLTANALHYNQLPTSLVTDSLNPSAPPTKEKNGVINTVIPELSVSQTIFNPQLLYAAKSADLYVKQAEQITDSTKINIVETVSEAFYNLLLTLQQIKVLREDTAELTKSYNDAYHQYVGGIVDQTDYKEAAISLNNTKVQLKQAVENVVPQYANLKQLMGYPSTTQFNVNFDTAKMMGDIAFDTTLQLKYENRIEYQQLQTSKSLQHQLINYYRLAYLPTASIFYNYFYEFESNTASNLFAASYPYSYFGLSLTMPIFTGFSRIKSVQRARMQEQLLDLDEDALKSEIYTEYATALANYKSNLYDFYQLRDNEKMAGDVYDIVTLQYKQGTVAYLNVITAQDNLITSQIGYLNALFQVLSSKIDLEKSMGIISYNR
jgi:outer membrane protein TolC